MRRVCISVMCIVPLLMACQVCSEATAYRIRDLGTWQANAINDVNQIVGGGDGHAILWQDGVAREIFEGFGTDINNLGQVLDGDALSIWRNGTTTFLPRPSHPNIPYISAHAYSLNDKGQVVGYASGSSSPPQYKMNSAVLWQNDSYIPLWSSPYETTAAALDINSSGHAVGCDGRGYARGAANDLLYVQSSAYAVNDSDQVVGSYGYGCPPSDLPCSGGYPDHAFLSQGNDWWDLGTLGGATSCALAINNAGLVVGYAVLGDGTIHASLWQNNVISDLGTLGGLGESRAYGINNNGWIIGSSNGHAVLWQPMVPEPSALLALLCGLSGLSMLRRRR